MSGTTPTTELLPFRKKLRIEIKQPQDSDITRDRVTRWMMLATTVLTTAFAPGAILYSVASDFGPNASMFSLLLGIIAGTLCTPYPLTRSLVSNEEWKGYATLNPFNGKRVLYGPGMHPAFFWEQRNASGEISFQAVSINFEVGVQTTTSTLISKGTFAYQVDTKGLQNYIGIDPSVVQTGFLSYVSNFLTGKISRLTAIEAQEMIDQINDNLADEFMGTVVRSTDASGETSVVTDFEREFGIRVVSLFIESMKLPPKVQEARDGLDETTRIRLVCAELMGLTIAQYDAKVANGEITIDQAAELQRRAMVITGNATATYDRVDGGAGIVLTRPT